mmetsp:Transcript_45383/g.128062  ORF Transcript_45383/g.128062 Transcript_45383/m.128062 type:complete len:210 (+) Transcript_45383:181-810(+)
MPLEKVEHPIHNDVVVVWRLELKVPDVVDEVFLLRTDTPVEVFIEGPDRCESVCRAHDKEFRPIHTQNRLVVAPEQNGGEPAERIANAYIPTNHRQPLDGSPCQAHDTTQRSATQTGRAHSCNEPSCCLPAIGAPAEEPTRRILVALRCLAAHSHAATTSATSDMPVTVDQPEDLLTPRMSNVKAGKPLSTVKAAMPSISCEHPPILLY